MADHDRLARLARPLAFLGRRGVSRAIRAVLALAVIGLLYPISGGRIFRLEILEGTFLQPSTEERVETGGTDASVDITIGRFALEGATTTSPPTTSRPRTSRSTLAQLTTSRSATTQTTATRPPPTVRPTSTVQPALPATSGGATTTTSNPRVVFFQDGPGSGVSWTVTTGVYGFNAVAASPVGNDAISSLRIDPGLQVLVCQDADDQPQFRGICVRYGGEPTTGSVTTVSDLGPLDNQISWLEVTAVQPVNG